MVGQGWGQNGYIGSEINQEKRTGYSINKEKAIACLPVYSSRPYCRAFPFPECLDLWKNLQGCRQR